MEVLGKFEALGDGGVVPVARLMNLDMAGEVGNGGVFHVDLKAANHRVGRGDEGHRHDDRRQQHKIAAFVAQDVTQTELQDQLQRRSPL